jgi:hypothetical protein
MMRKIEGGGRVAGKGRERKRMKRIIRMMRGVTTKRHLSHGPGSAR